MSAEQPYQDREDNRGQRKPGTYRSRREYLTYENELGYILFGNERLKPRFSACVGRTATCRYSKTRRGVKVGDTVELTGEMLSAVLVGFAGAGF